MNRQFLRHFLAPTDTLPEHTPTARQAAPAPAATHDFLLLLQLPDLAAETEVSALPARG